MEEDPGEENELMDAADIDAALETAEEHEVIEQSAEEDTPGMSILCQYAQQANCFSKSNIHLLLMLRRQFAHTHLCMLIIRSHEGTC